MRRDRWVVAVVAVAVIALSLMFRRETFVDAPPVSPDANRAAVLEYVDNESYQGFKTLGVDEGVRNVLRALADVVRGKFVNGVYPTCASRFTMVRAAEHLVWMMGRGVSVYHLVHPGARGHVSQADFDEAVEQHKAEYIATLRRTVLDDYGELDDFVKRCPAG